MRPGTVERGAINEFALNSVVPERGIHRTSDTDAKGARGLVGGLSAQLHGSAQGRAPIFWVKPIDPRRHADAFRHHRNTIIDVAQMTTPHEMSAARISSRGISYTGRWLIMTGPTNQLFHAWVEAYASDGVKWLIDFTPKYWQASEGKIGEVTLPGVRLRPINWVVPPPEQFVGPMSELVYRLKPGEGTPPLGCLTLIRCSRTTAFVRKADASNPALAVSRSGQHVEMLDAPTDDAGIERMLEQARARGITEITLVYPDEKTGRPVRHSTINVRSRRPRHD
jgi:hypothetical protein